MFTGAARQAVGDEAGPGLFAAIGRFLSEHRLPFEPSYYAFAHRLLSEPNGPLAHHIATLTDDGVRLTTQDVDALGTATRTQPEGDASQLLADRTEHQMREFAALTARMRAETQGFGRDLAVSVDALDVMAAPEVLRVAAAMLDRVRTAEARLEQANGEAEALREQLEQARGDARSDALTGLPNRRALIEDFGTRSVSGAPLFLAVCDIDHFKRINDRFGHPIGDRVLRAIAGALAETCGAAFVTRYGGEEFAVLFTGGVLADAAATLDRARAAVAAKRYKVRDDHTPLGAVTFSAGIVAVGAGEAFDAAFDRADALLYAAKSGGRNQIQY